MWLWQIMLSFWKQWEDELKERDSKEQQVIEPAELFHDELVHVVSLLPCRFNRIFHPSDRNLVFLQRIKRKCFSMEIGNIEMILKSTMRWCWTSISRNRCVNSPTKWISWEGIYMQWPIDFISSDKDHIAKIYLWI